MLNIVLFSPVTASEFMPMKLYNLLILFPLDIQKHLYLSTHLLNEWNCAQFVYGVMYSDRSFVGKLKE